MKKIKIFISAIILGISPLLAQNNAEDKGFEISKNLEIFSSVYKNIHLNYVDDIEPGKLMTTAINAMLSSLDPYTNYIPESNIEDVKLLLSKDGKNDYYSLYDYYYISSHGKLTLDITVLDFWFTPQYDSSYYSKFSFMHNGKEESDINLI